MGQLHISDNSVTPRLQSTDVIVGDKWTSPDKRIYLFKRSDYKDPTWFCRLKIPKQKGYIQRSTQTEDFNEAHRFARNLYDDCYGKVILGQDLKSKIVATALKEYVDYITQFEQPSQSRKSKLSYLIRWQDFFKKKRLREIGVTDISDLIDWTSTNSKKDSLSPATIVRFLKHLKAFFKWCEEKGHIDKLPKFPVNKAELNRRPHFSKSEWKEIRRLYKTHANVKNIKLKRQRICLACYMDILIETGIRISEARILKWADIEVVPADDDVAKHIILSVLSNKTGKRKVVCLNLDVLENLEIFKIFSLKQLGREPSKYDFVFANDNGEPIHTFRKAFDTFMREAGFMYNSYNEKRTIYSLRHSYATFKIEEGVDYTQVAKNMGTSVEMIENYYGHFDTRSVAQSLTRSKQKLKA